MKLLIAVLTLVLAAAALAEGKKIPLDEAGFVAAMPNASAAEVVEALGTPDRVIAQVDRNGKVVASVLRYRNLVSNAQGDYYRCTDLEIVGDRVVNVLFTNVDEQTDSPMTF